MGRIRYSIKRQYKKEYAAWNALKKRCYNPKDKGYCNYGGRGIKVCDRWKNSFKNFLSDMGKAPTKDHSLDRYPDMNGNYEPSNCRWATRAEQATNTRRNRRIEWRGQTKTLSQWANEIGINEDSLFARLSADWSVDDAFTIPILKPQKIGRDSEVLSYYKGGLRIVEIATITGIKYQTVAWKIRKARINGQI